MIHSNILAPGDCFLVADGALADKRKLFILKEYNGNTLLVLGSYVQLESKGWESIDGITRYALHVNTSGKEIPASITISSEYPYAEENVK